MTFEQNLLQLLLILLASSFVTYGVVRWRNTRETTSVFTQDNSLEDIGLSALSSLFDTAPKEIGNGRMMYRPTWGIRLVAPAVATLFLAASDLVPLLNSLGLTASWQHSIVYIGLFALLGYSWTMLLFVQRVECDAHYVRCHGVDLRTQTRRLDDLVEIRVHEKRPALVLTFSNQPPLYIPKFLSHRDSFIRKMQSIADHNGNNGCIAPIPTWQARMGF